MQNSQRGFSLVEVMIAFILIGVASLSLIKLQAYVEQRSDFAVKSIQALNIAESQLEWFRSRGASAALSSIPPADFPSITSGSDATTYAPFTVRWQTSEPAATLSNALKTITVTTEWRDRLDTAQTLSVTTMMSSYSEFADD
ncbi:prepilin-type N-terminal cleavage/methylation domain-containing protein [Vibrio cholerae]